MENYVRQIRDGFSVVIDRVEPVAIDADRLEIYKEVIPALDQTQSITVVVGSVEGQSREFLFCNDTLITLSCQVTFEDLSPADCIEFSFAEEPNRWHLAQVSTEALQDFRQKKFRLWEHQLKEPECEAAFRRILQQGPVHNVYDKFIFPNPPSLASLFKVTDEHSGKVVEIPHQVAKMRKWNPQDETYYQIDASLVGAPASKEQAEIYWQHTIEQLKDLRGEEYIDSLLK